MRRVVLSAMRVAMENFQKSAVPGARLALLEKRAHPVWIALLANTKKEIQMIPPGATIVLVGITNQRLVKDRACRVLLGSTKINPRKLNAKHVQQAQRWQVQPLSLLTVQIAKLENLSLLQVKVHVFPAQLENGVMSVV